MPSSSPLRIPIDELDAFCRAALGGTGMNAANAATAAGALVTTDGMGVFTHGTKLLAGYVRRLRGGGYRAAAQPRVVREGPAWAVLDGEASLGQIGCDAAIKTAIGKAREAGVAYVGVRNTGHIGAAGYFAAQGARQGCLVMITGNDIPSVAAPGSRKAVLGSNPLAYAVPVADGDPLLLDMATAAVAGGKVYAAIQRGEPIPDTWLIGPDGRPTTDASLYPQEAALAPMAAHKGYGLALWAEIVSGLLPGGAVTWQMGSWLFDEPSRPSLHNAGIVAMDVRSICPAEEFAARLAALTAEIHAAPAAEGVDRVRLPGEREWDCLKRARHEGIALPDDVLEKLDMVAAECRLKPLRNG